MISDGLPNAQIAGDFLMFSWMISDGLTDDLR
jgi:hypothetical protein